MAVSDRLQEVRMELHQGLTQVRQEMNENLLQTRDKTDQRLQALQESNEQRLEQMRQTVEEKLEKTLQTRLQASFETVSKQLESVNRGLEKCRLLPAMSEHSTRFYLESRREGFWENCNWGKSSRTLWPCPVWTRICNGWKLSERVEYAIKLPGQGDQEYVYLPIDSKFPLADYYRLEEALRSRWQGWNRTLSKSL